MNCTVLEDCSAVVTSEVKVELTVSREACIGVDVAALDRLVSLVTGTLVSTLETGSEVEIVSVADTSFVLVLTNSVAADRLLVSTEVLVVTGVNEVLTSMVVAVEIVVSLVVSSEVDSTLVVDGTEDTGTLDMFSNVLAPDDIVVTGEVVVRENALVDVEGDDVASETVVVRSLDCELTATGVDSA